MSKGLKTCIGKNKKFQRNKKAKNKRRCAMGEVKGVFVKRIFISEKEGFDLVLTNENEKPVFLVTYFKKNYHPRCEMGVREYFCEFCRYYNPVSLSNCDIKPVWVEFYHPHEDDYVCRPCRPANEKELELAGIKPR
jgi:hypothetical protein